MRAGSVSELESVALAMMCTEPMTSVADSGVGAEGGVEPKVPLEAMMEVTFVSSCEELSTRKASEIESAPCDRGSSCTCFSLERTRVELTVEAEEAEGARIFERSTSIDERIVTT